jgi:hypothetical protein
LEKKKLKQQNGEVEENKTIENNKSQNVDISDNEDIYSSKRPKFEHKIKVTNNDSFLKQVFS